LGFTNTYAYITNMSEANLYEGNASITRV